MKASTIVFTVLTIFFVSCSNQNYKTSKGLVFDSRDWGVRFEQPYIMTGQDAAAEDTKVYRMYLSALMFEGVEIDYAYFRQMKSSMISKIGNKNPQILVVFDESQHMLDDSMFGISDRQAVVVLKTKNGSSKIVKLEDMRIVK
ncbi:hypothetical protein BST97_10270 [Nonlabens spongiae]|uniref:Uncharacterized protein n=1 Tax=Nonlabens spongiae TaxID=331648 RepID=A0A1W6ML94_9FLAO|nr:hypothetical protein BST97_10270 [Nonlabens spongiae]